MKRPNDAIVTGGTAVLGLFAAAFFQLGTLGGDITAWVCTMLAGLLFIYGLLLPRIRGGRRDEASDKDGGVATNQAKTVKAEANFTKKSDGGIELNVGVSTTGADDTDSHKVEEDEEPDGT